MESIRHIEPPGQLPSSVEDDTDRALLDAARATLLAVGWRRTTLTAVARSAGVSRMTVYRRYGDVEALVSDLFAREWSAVVLDAVHETGLRAPAPQQVARAVGRAVALLRANPVFRTIVGIDPEVLLTYLLQRPGRAQTLLVEWVERLVVAGQEDGSVRVADPGRLARGVLLAAHGFALSAHTLADPGAPERDLDDELVTLLTCYLTP